MIPDASTRNKIERRIKVKIEGSLLNVLFNKRQGGKEK